MEEKEAGREQVTMKALGRVLMINTDLIVLLFVCIQLLNTKRNCRIIIHFHWFKYNTFIEVHVKGMFRSFFTGIQ